jgi:GNAT superfamily N-acetyltransferase
MSDSLTLRPFQPADARAFRELNEAWISQLFVLEEKDRLTLNDPQGQIIAPGGHILMAELDGQPAGCCALLPIEPGVYELAKMCVAEPTRGQGLGRRIMLYAIEYARSIGAQRLYLETSHKLLNAIHLYESVGFRHLAPERVVPSPYARADVYMDMPLG